MSKRFSAVQVPLALLAALAFSASAIAAVRGNTTPTPPPPPAAPPPPVTVVVTTTTAPFIAPTAQCGAGGHTSISKC